jgi:hypothetical protein
LLLETFPTDSPGVPLIAGATPNDAVDSVPFAGLGGQIDFNHRATEDLSLKTLKQCPTKAAHVRARFMHLGAPIPSLTQRLDTRDRGSCTFARYVHTEIWILRGQVDTDSVGLAIPIPIHSVPPYFTTSSRHFVFSTSKRVGFAKQEKKKTSVSFPNLPELRMSRNC